MATLRGSIRRSSWSCWVAALLIGALGFAGQAADILVSVGPAQVRTILGEMDLEVEQILDEDGDPVWRFIHRGVLTTLIPYDRQSDGRFASLLFYAGWAVETPPSVDQINAWNRGARFGRAYIDAEGDPVIELDLLLRGGVVAETLKIYIDVFVESALTLESIFR